jgi:uncharacterized protein (DUF302 family)
MVYSSLVREILIMTSMAFEVKLDTSWQTSLDRVIAALKGEGFGVLTRIIDPAAMMQAGGTPS